jgi:hypothetical protein
VQPRTTSLGSAVVRLAADAVATRRSRDRMHVGRSEEGTTTSVTAIRTARTSTGGACRVRSAMESANSRRAQRQSGEREPGCRRGASGSPTPALTTALSTARHEFEKTAPRELSVSPPSCGAFEPRSGKFESIQIHDLAPSRHEVVHELRSGVVGRIDLRECTEL